VFRIATFNVRDLFDDVAPHVIGQLDRDGFSAWAQKRARTLYARKLDAIAAMVLRADADVIAFQEVEGAHVLDALRAHLPSGGGYLPAVAGNADARGIACGILSRFPITSVEIHGVGELAFVTQAVQDASFLSAGVYAFTTVFFLLVAVVLTGLGQWYQRRFPRK
jgi:hypothetical protein